VHEASENHLWNLTDKLGNGATSDVFKAYNIITGEVVAAKVSKVLCNIRPTRRSDAEKKSDSHSIFDREINFLKNVNHENIVRFIGKSTVISSDNTNALPDREVLFIEYCNGGSVGDMLRLPANRYGLNENIIMQLVKDVISALKYLHRKTIVSSQSNFPKT
jgi:serine/threonine protein kinase